MESEIGRFEYRGENGQTHLVIEIQEYTAFRPLSGSTKWVKGLKRLELEDGSPVNFIDATRCKIVTTGEIIHRP